MFLHYHNHAGTKFSYHSDNRKYSFEPFFYSETKLQFPTKETTFNYCYKKIFKLSLTNSLDFTHFSENNFFSLKKTIFEPSVRSLIILTKSIIIQMLNIYSRFYLFIGKVFLSENTSLVCSKLRKKIIIYCYKMVFFYFNLITFSKKNFY